MSETLWWLIIIAAYTTVLFIVGEIRLRKRRARRRAVLAELRTAASRERYERMRGER